jgi:plasmid maintenance system antidote protein VapI
MHDRRARWRWRGERDEAATPHRSRGRARRRVCITDILNGKRKTSETATRLARYLDNSARFWLNLQTAYELAVAEAELGEPISSQVMPAA